jgi:hypothetical protein
MCMRVGKIKRCEVLHPEHTAGGPPTQRGVDGLAAMALCNYYVLFCAARVRAGMASTHIKVRGGQHKVDSAERSVGLSCLVVRLFEREGRVTVSGHWAATALGRAGQAGWLAERPAGWREGGPQTHNEDVVGVEAASAVAHAVAGRQEQGLADESGTALVPVAANREQEQAARPDKGAEVSGALAGAGVGEGEPAGAL